ncbi:MAG: quinolinate synthase NadA [Alphaproteobacteria bacterium]|nr:MAG: quinolinate synthase NadA [Alphaproteobacteria bacterium]
MQTELLTRKDAKVHDHAPAIDKLYDRIRHVVPEIEWHLFKDDIREILRLKKERNAIILAHNYMTPEIFHCVSDFVGDSLALARQAEATEADIIVMCGVHFMAETAKLLNPQKTVLIPDLNAGCSLAESITGEDVRKLKAANPGVPVVTYINTTAGVKAETDICCTSGNAVEVVESLGVDKVIMIPDEYLARNIAKKTNVEMITWPGRCEVHEQFTRQDLQDIRTNNEDVVILAHPECPPDVLDEADFAGSTSAMLNYVEDKRPNTVALITECSMSDNIAARHPEIAFVRPCNLCPHMKRISLKNIRTALEDNLFEVVIDPTLAEKARRPVDRMLALKK